MTIHALSPVRTIAPAVTPVTLAEAKAHLRVDHTDEDDLITALVGSATGQLDGWSGILGRCLITQTWRQDMPSFCSVRLPFPNVQSVTVAYTDTDGSAQTLAASSYHLVNDAIGGAVVLADGASWPDTDPTPDAVRITLVAGYGLAADVPAPIKAAILLHIGHLYANREAVDVGQSVAAMPMAYDFLIAPYRRVGM